MKDVLWTLGAILAPPCGFYLVMYVLRVPWYFLTSLVQVLGRLPGSSAPVIETTSGQRARLSYFRGPAWADFREVSEQARHRVNSLAIGGAERDGDPGEPAGITASTPSIRQELRTHLQIPAGYRPIVTWPGIGVGIVLAAPMAAIYALTVAAATVGVGIAGPLLKVSDQIWARLRRVSMSCPDPSCGYRRVDFPVYACPRCLVRHDDIRPGRRGVLHFHCECGELLPTTLRRASARLTAYCPAPDQVPHELTHRPGEAPEIVMPFLGAVGAGKTRLMYALATVLRWTPPLRTEFADAPTRARLAQAERALGPGADVDVTGPERPCGYLLRIGRGRQRRVLQLFDANGERFYHAGQTKELRYLAHARTFVLVFDPLAVTEVRQSLPVARQQELSRPEVPTPELVYDLVHPLLAGQGVRLRGARLAIVLTHADQMPVPQGDLFAEWVECEFKLGNLIRSAGLQFAEVRLFSTASVVEDGVMDPSIAVLARWLLGKAGAEIADKTTAIPGSDNAEVARPVSASPPEPYRAARLGTYAWVCGLALFGLVIACLVL